MARTRLPSETRGDSDTSDAGTVGRDAALGEVCGRLLERAPTAFAVTRGEAHVLVWANPVFRRFFTDGEDPVGRPVAEAVGMAGLGDLLDRALDEARAFRDLPVGGGGEGPSPWTCSVWPDVVDRDEKGGLMIELQPARHVLAWQRQVAEQLLLGALREEEAAEASEEARVRAAFLAEVSRTLAESLDEGQTLNVVQGLHLPGNAEWCIVDVLEREGEMRRLAIVHPDEAKRAAVRRLEDEWRPRPGDPFGVPALRDATDFVALTQGVQDAVALASHSRQNLEALQDLGIGSLLTVPMHAHGHVLGALTFVGPARHHAYTHEEVRLAQQLALQSAMALDSAHLYGDAVRLRVAAEKASRTKTRFLAHMSHELRTPLNSIAGYVDILDLEIHGPLTDAQRNDLRRVRVNQRHLLSIIDDIVGFMHVDSGKVSYDISDLPANEVLSDAVALTEPMMAERRLTSGGIRCDETIRVRADADRLHQILVNLLANAVKYTPPGGRIDVGCEATDGTVLLTVSDTGVGIPPDRLEAVFEPFVQAARSTPGMPGGVGLGLAISRELARGMGGDLTAVSTSGEGSCFTVSLPRAAAPRAE